jgi:hypothetical protein
MLVLQRQRARTQLGKTDILLRSRPVKDAGLVEHRIGHWLERYASA